VFKCKLDVARDLNFIVKCEGLLKVTGSHIRWKSSNIAETLLDRDVTKATIRKRYSYIYGLSNSNNYNDLECP